ncbi:hypothetical protein J4Q44_G00290660, partial [Coregonus suidteri]
VALRFWDETKVWLNLFCHCVFLLSRPLGLYIYHGGKAYELTGYRVNNAIITTQVVIWLFSGFPSDFTHAPLLDSTKIYGNVFIPRMI